MDLASLLKRSGEIKRIIRKFPETLASVCTWCNAYSCSLCKSCDCVANVYTYEDVHPDWGDIYDGLQMQPQSETVEEKVTEANSSNEQVVSFEDQKPGESLDLSTPVNYIMSTPAINAELKDFVKRPVQLATFVWNEASDIGISYFPWKLYISKASIQRKFQNYYLLRANLHIKLVINASPFYYGSGLLAYQPLYGFNPGAILNSSGSEDRVPYSQRPNIYFDAASCTGGEMILPFIYHKEWLDITSNSDVEGMGELVMKSYTILKNANGVAGGSVDIQILGWLEDVVLSGPTEKLTLQCDTEYTQGPVSKVASAVSRATGALSKEPIIGPFMTATSAISKGIGSIAHSLGYSNPPNINQVEYFKGSSHPQLASTEISVPFEKLTIDSKNELSIDPKISGADLGDEMTISSIAQRESFLTEFDWLQASAPDTNIFAAQVAPTMRRVVSLTQQTAMYDTPMGHLARAFSFWRGDIIFRFKVVATPYHKGRLKLVWDPATSPGATAFTESYTKVVDISETTDFEFRVPFIQPTAYLDVPTSSTASFWSTLTLSPTTGVNGVLEIKVFNKLTAPDATSDIKVLTFVRAAENFELMAPADPPVNISYYTVQSETTYDNIPNTVTDPNISLVYGGEQVKSIRQLVRRMCDYSCTRFTPASFATDALQTNRIFMSRRPRYPGYDLDGQETANSKLTPGPPPDAEPYNFVRWTYMTWFSPCYIAERGSVNWIANSISSVPYCRLYAARERGNISSYYSSGGHGATLSEVAYATVSNGASLGGACEVNANTQSCISFSAPQYTVFKFQSTSPNARTLGITGDGSNVDAIEIHSWYQPDALTSAQYNSAIHMYVGAGIDYSLVFFLNIPVKYFYSGAVVTPWVAP